MRLTEFIEQHRERIIAEWVQFAGTLLPWAKGMTDEALRDHAEELLAAVVADMKEPQTALEKSEKSKGQAAVGELGRVGHQHAAERLESGFNLDQLVSEYRALRASVLRLWEAAQGDKQGQVTRFNEAIDETLAESTLRYSDTVETTREQFIGVLGHDLRTPLNAIVVGAKLLSTSEQLDDKHARIAARILSSAERMTRMVSELLDLTRTRLGPGIPISRKPTDLKRVCEQVLAELEAGHPEATVMLESAGDPRGEWDSDRLAQLVSNLVSNALEYGAGQVRVRLDADGETVTLVVHNRGGAIPEAALRQIFEPMTRHSTGDSGDRNKSGLGLGLYIAREIATAHGGTLEVTSSEGSGTTFTARIPRNGAAD